MLGPENRSDRRISSYEVKVAENRVGVAGVGLGLGATILLSALTGLGLPRPVWAVAAGIGAMLLVYALLVEGSPEGKVGVPAATQYNDGGTGHGDRFFINQVNLSVPQPREAPPAGSEPADRGNQGGRGEGD
jgi:hypothetical protein